MEHNESSGAPEHRGGRRRRHRLLVALALLPALLGAALLLTASDGEGASSASSSPDPTDPPTPALAARTVDDGTALGPDDIPPGPTETSRPGLPARSVVSGPSVDDGAEPSSAAMPRLEQASGPVGLHPDDGVFWNGAFVESGTVVDASLCDVLGPCFEYPLELAASGARLRVAIDTPSREDTFVVQILDPAGAVVASTSNQNQFNAEVFLAEPAAGAYSVRVLPQTVEDAAFRMRAKLEQALEPVPAGRVAMLPNLQVVPPYEFGFTAPVTPNGSYPPDVANPGASVGGHSLYSCTQDEAAPVEVGGSGAVDCLRLTSGPMNVGPGPFDMRFTFIEDMVDGTADPAYLRGPIFQTIHQSDGSEEVREAGQYIFHTTHAHFHDENILTYEGFDVLDTETGELAKFGSGTKSGFCPADQLFGDWFAFDQAVRGDFGEGDSPTGNCMDPKDGLLGLTSGWGDVYRWQRPGQYVEFDGKGDGLYVIRSTVDAANAILETDETDNTSYALIKVVGRTIDIIERGQGTDPWDPEKVVFEGDGPASVR